MLESYLDIKSIDPSYWGQSGWVFLNSIALTYEPKYKENYKNFILQLPYILPCKTCGENLKKNINTLDDALESKEKLLKWLLNIRNSIYEDNNQINKKKNLNDTFNEIFHKKCDIENYFYLILSVIILGTLIVIYKYNKDKEND